MAKPATRAEIAMYGHMAAALRAFLKQRDMAVPELSEALGLDRKSATPYRWLSGKGGPAPALRAKLAKLTGIPETDLMPRKPGQPAPVPSQAVAVIPATKLAPPVRVGDVLSFVVSGDGMARIKLDATLPLATATPLFRMLLDAGIVFGGEPAE